MAYTNSYQEEMRIRENRIKDWERTILASQVQMARPQMQPVSYYSKEEWETAVVEDSTEKEEKSKKLKLQNLIAYYYGRR